MFKESEKKMPRKRTLTEDDEKVMFMTGKRTGKPFGSERKSQKKTKKRRKIQIKKAK
mgnify:CR=1 FL=1